MHSPFGKLDDYLFRLNWLLQYNQRIHGGCQEDFGLSDTILSEFYHRDAGRQFNGFLWNVLAGNGTIVQVATFLRRVDEIITEANRSFARN